MKIYYEELKKFKPWSGAVDTYNRIKEAGKLNQLESILDDSYPAGMSETELNDLLWFDEDTVYEWLDMPSENEPEEDDEEEE